MDYQDGYRSQSWVESDSGPAKTEKSMWPTCLMGCLGMLFVIAVVVVIGGYFAFTRGPAILADYVHTQLVDGIRESDLPLEEKDAIIHQLDRVVLALKNGEIDRDDLQKAMQDITKSPLLGAGALMAVESKYLDPSGLSDEEKDQARRVLQRVWRGSVEEKVEFEELESAMDIISIKNGDQRRMKDKLSDDELREFISQLKSIADEHEIPDEPFDVRISDEVRKIVDNVLGPEEGVQQGVPSQE